MAVNSSWRGQRGCAPDTVQLPDTTSRSSKLPAQHAHSSTPATLDPLATSDSPLRQQLLL
eukprot:COSAG06_NODE_5079_length_3736_cov_3.059033_4_plen_60_part_00